MNRLNELVMLLFTEAVYLTKYLNKSSSTYSMVPGISFANLYGQGNKFYCLTVKSSQKLDKFTILQSKKQVTCMKLVGVKQLYYYTPM